MTAYHCQWAWLGGASVAPDVLVEVHGERIAAVRPGVPRPEGSRHLDGLTLPGFADTHSHAFHRVLRGVTPTAVGGFIAWRERMYAVAARLSPETYRQLARAVFAEMALAGVSAVGEFHYLHHSDGGAPYPQPNAMGAALVEAAREAGIRLTLLDACYLTSGVDARPVRGVQRRFADPGVQGWLARVEALAGDLQGQPGVRPGAAVHSVRAVPAPAAARVARLARERGWPLHLHLSEQPAENAEARAATSCTPTELLAGAGVLARGTTAVHATHLAGRDLDLLAGSQTGVCLCPSTERDLGDGIGPAGALAAAGVPLSLGSDSHAVLDLLEEARLVELHERLATGHRGRFTPAQLLTAATSGGMAALGWDAGRLAAGQLADLVTVRVDGVRLAGTAADLLAGVTFAASADDVTDVVVSGQPIVAAGRHLRIPDVAAALAGAIAELAASEPPAPRAGPRATPGLRGGGRGRPGRP